MENLERGKLKPTFRRDRRQACLRCARMAKALDEKLSPIFGQQTNKPDLLRTMGRLRDYARAAFRVEKSLRPRKKFRVRIDREHRFDYEYFSLERIELDYKKISRVVNYIRNLEERAKNKNGYDESHIIRIWDLLDTLEIVEVDFARAALAHHAGRRAGRREYLWDRK